MQLSTRRSSVGGEAHVGCRRRAGGGDRAERPVGGLVARARAARGAPGDRGDRQAEDEQAQPTHDGRPQLVLWSRAFPDGGHPAQLCAIPSAPPGKLRRSGRKIGPVAVTPGARRPTRPPRGHRWLPCSPVSGSPKPGPEGPCVPGGVRQDELEGGGPKRGETSAVTRRQLPAVPTRGQALPAQSPPP